MKRILLLYTSVGMGHKALADNIGEHLRQQGYEVKTADIEEIQAGLFARLIIPAHQFINRHLPFVWGWLYRWGHYAVLPFRVAIAGLNYKKTLAAIIQFQPDMIISTQTTASAVIAYLKKKGYYRELFGIAFHDYHFHPYWVYPGADFYLANIEEQKEVMRRYMKEKKMPPVFVCGMTLQPKPLVDELAIRSRLGIAQDERVLLIASGSLGTAMPARWVATLAEQLAQEVSKKYKIKIIILCGKNKGLLRELSRKIENPRIMVTGYYAPIAELYAIADIFLTKPGALTIAEGLQWRLPMLVTHWLPGQELLNYRYLQSKRLIMPGPDNVRAMKPKEIVARVMQELETGNFRKSLFANGNVVSLVQADPPVAAVQVVNQMFHTP